MTPQEVNSVHTQGRLIKKTPQSHTNEPPQTCEQNGIVTNGVVLLAQAPVISCDDIPRLMYTKNEKSTEQCHVSRSMVHTSARKPEIAKTIPRTETHAFHKASSQRYMCRRKNERGNGSHSRPAKAKTNKNTNWDCWYRSRGANRNSTISLAIQHSDISFLRVYHKISILIKQH